MRLKNDTNNFAASFNITPPYQMMVIHSSKLIYPREVYQRRVHRSQVELIAADFNEYIANEPKVSFRNGRYYVVDGQHTIEGRILRNGGKDLPILCKVYEEQEEGVSGHKVRAEARDKLQIIKEYARKGKFDILLVFMQTCTIVPALKQKR